MSDTDTNRSNLTTFYHLLVNTLVASVTNYTIWFAITFFTYLQTHSVFATAIISGIFLVATALSGIWFGSLVDHYKKKTVMLWSSVVSLVAYAVCFILYMSTGADAYKDPTNPVLWIFVTILLAGVIVGSIRTIALSTLVTILTPEDRRDKANGLVGTASGVAFLVTSVISGFLVAKGGMYYVLLLGLAATTAVLLHLWHTNIPEKGVAHTEYEKQSKKVDIRGTMLVIGAVPGLFALIWFNTFNNFLGGVSMALMDAYGLSLVSVEVWGTLWGVLSVGMIVGGLIVTKRGLGKNPLRTLFMANVVIWMISSIFTIQASIILLSVGMLIYLTVIPFIEAAEQAILQKVVPQERQGRVFGFAQSIEQAASPLTAFLIGPIAQFIFIPFMTDGAGADTIGSWFGAGPDRGLALLFTVAGIIGLIVTLFAFASKYYKQLSARYLEA